MTQKATAQAVIARSTEGVTPRGRAPVGRLVLRHRTAGAAFSRNGEAMTGAERMFQKLVSILLLTAVFFVCVPYANATDAMALLDAAANTAKKGDPAKAVEMTLAVLKTDPNNLSAMELYVTLLMMQKDYKKVVATVLYFEKQGIVSLYLYQQLARALFILDQEGLVTMTFFKMEQLVYEANKRRNKK